MTISIAVQSCPSARVAVLLRTLAAATIALAAPAAIAQSVFDDFSSGNDSAWTRFDGNQTVFGVPTTFDASGGVYRITSPAVPNVNYLPIISSVRTDAVNTDAVISVDVVDWSGPMQFGLIARGQADFSFYAAYFTPVSVLSPNASNFRISRFNWNSTIGDVVETIIAGGLPFAQVNQSNDYRITFSQTGSLLEATLFNISTSTVERSLSTIDAGIGSFTSPGAAGITMYSNDNSSNDALSPYSVSFDNFLVVPTPGAASMLGLGGILAARRRR